VIRVENVTKIYKMGSTEVAALRDVSLEIRRGEFIAIMGASGSGKSTFMNLIGCLDRPTSGSCYLDGQDVAGCSDDELADIRSRRVGFVFQTFNLLARTTARENVALPLSYRRSQRLAADRRRPDALLEAVGLPERGAHRPSELSGGEQQRVAIARALVNSPTVIMADEPTGNLDTEHSHEIMEMLVDLNDAGVTVVLVTHEEDIALYAKRLVRFRDGRVVSDRAVAKRRTPERRGSLAGALRAEPGAAERDGARRGAGFSALEIVEHMHAAVRTLWHNRMRSVLTALGILIGVAAVIAMVSVGRGAQADVQKRIEGLGSNLLSVMPGSTRSGIAQGGAGSAGTLTLEDADAIREQITDLAGVAPQVGSRGQVKYKRNNWATSITGTVADYPVVRSWPIGEGTFITDADVASHRNVCVLGYDIAANLFEGEDPLNKVVRIRNGSFRVVGVMSQRGGGGFGSQDDVVFVPVTTAINQFTGNKQVQLIFVSVAEKSLMEKARGDVEWLLRDRHRIPPAGQDDFMVISQEDVLSTMESVSMTLTLLLASIAGISLLVGGIGIMNIMLVSVTERTREIGIRKAIGARRKDIMLQFLTEAVILSVIGGLSGWVLGAVAARVISAVGKLSAVVSPATVLLAVGFSLTVGIFFGIYPARKASRLDPIESLRYE
jgi:macrolide transport system ATP-binding/permease protein